MRQEVELAAATRFIQLDEKGDEDLSFAPQCDILIYLID